MNNKISNERKIGYYLGTGMMVLGFILFISVFFSGLSGGFDTFRRAPIGMVIIIVGSIIRGIGQKGLAGSGVILDPEHAREDLEPHTRAIGGMVNDALEEVKILNPTQSIKEVVKVRCPSCGHLNDETDKYCAECGVKI